MIPKNLQHFVKRGYKHFSPTTGLHLFKDESTVMIALNANHGKYLVRVLDEIYQNTEASPMEILRIELNDMIQRPDEIICEWLGKNNEPSGATIYELALKYHRKISKCFPIDEHSWSKQVEF